MSKRPISPWRKRARAGGLFLLSLASTTALSHAQTSPQSDDLPLCTSSYPWSGVTVYAALHAASRSANTARTHISVTPPLKAQSIAQPAFVDVPLLPKLRLVWTLDKNNKLASVTSTLDVAAALRSDLPRPTGCSLYLDNALTDGPIQMKGIDNIAHNTPHCIFKLYGATSKSVLQTKEHMIRVHGPYDDDILSFTFQTAFSNGFLEEAQEVSADLNTDWTDQTCTPLTPKAGASPCFISTAACKVVGLEDGCWELQQLRTFRDSWLVHQDGGADDVATYYAIAPQMCERLSASAKGQDAMLRLYWKRIVPCAIASKLGFNRLTRRWYGQMMTDLSAAMARQEYAA